MTQPFSRSSSPSPPSSPPFSLPFPFPFPPSPSLVATILVIILKINWPNLNSPNFLIFAPPPKISVTQFESPGVPLDASGYSSLFDAFWPIQPNFSGVTFSHSVPRAYDSPLSETVWNSKYAHIADLAAGCIMTKPDYPIVDMYGIAPRLTGRGFRKILLRSQKRSFLPCDALRCTVLVIVILSVCLSVCHTRGLCPHGSTYDHDFFTIW